jgi:ABC-type lipoprotein export system ATPase subunit
VKRPASISLDSVSKHYTTSSEEISAVNEITLELEPGSSLAITGPSGCGKSTLLGLIGGLEAPTRGRISIGGVDISRLSEGQRARLRRDEFGFVFQRDTLLPFLTAMENVSLQHQMKGATNGYETCRAMLAELGLEHQADKLPDQLSGGERQRVAIACALIKQPSVILADEPTGSLDSENSVAVIDLLLALHRQARATLIVVTHDAEVALRMDQVLGMRDGRLTKEGLLAGRSKTGHEDA